MIVEKKTDHILMEAEQSEESLKVGFINITHHTDDIFTLETARGNLDFMPGDCVSIFAGDGETSRPYSIASGNREDRLKFIIKQMDDGIVTNYLTQLKPGDTIKISRPYGWFRPGLNNGDRPFIFVATGTGIAPFLSYLHSFPDKAPGAFYYGVRKYEDAIGFTEFANVSRSTLAISRERKSGTFHGRVSELIQKEEFTPDTHFYLCGLDAMIDQVSEILEDKHIDLTQIHREVFFHAPSEPK